MDIVLGRPNHTENRLAKEVAVYDFLDRLNIEYWTVDHPAAYTMEDCQAVDAMLGTRMCKNLFLCNRQNTAFYLLLMPDDKPFKTKEVSHLIGSTRLSFADGSYMEQFLNITPGALSALGLMNDTENHVQLLIDDDLLQDEFIGCHPCVNTSSIKLRTRDLLGAFLEETHHPCTILHITGEA